MLCTTNNTPHFTNASDQMAEREGGRRGKKFAARRVDEGEKQECEVGAMNFIPLRGHYTKNQSKKETASLKQLPLQKTLNSVRHKSWIIVNRERDSAR